MVQQNASLVEEATAATESMKEQASSLLRMESRFKLGTDTPADSTQHAATGPHPATMPAPPRIRVKRRPAVPADFAAALGAPAATRNGNGEWKEF